MNYENIAKLNDARILKVATYAATKGTTKRVNGVAPIFRKFSELKRLVKSGEFKSLEDLEQSVYGIYGVMGKVIEDAKDDFTYILGEIEKARDDFDRYEKRDKK